MTGLRLIGRSSSHYTRVPRIFAHELAVPLELVVVHDMTSLDSGLYAGNPARKIPTLERGGSLVFGAENICRVIAETAPGEPRIVWPESVRAAISRNAQEMVEHAMSAQTQLVFGALICKLPADNLYFTKARAGLEGALAWLDSHLAAALRELPSPRDLSRGIL